MQPNSNTSSSVHAAFFLAACACWGSWAERKIYCAPTDVPCQKCQMVKVQKHFVPKRSFPLSFLGSCSTRNKLQPPETSRFFFLNWQEKIQAQAPCHLHLTPSHSLHLQLNTTDSFLDVLFYLTWPEEVSQQTIELTVPELWTDLDVQNRLTLIKQTL